MKQIYANNLTTLSLGRQGENLARKVVFDVRDLESLYGQGDVEVIHKRPGDAQPYPLAVQRNGTLVTWDVTATDTEMSAATANERYGKCELRYYAGETLAKSQIWRTWVESAMDTPSETAPPEPEQGWVDQVLAAGVFVKEATDSAKTYASSAEQSASGATQSAQEAAGSASTASTSETNAKASEESAKASETAAQASKTAAAGSASAAANSATSASASASAASESADAAAASKTAAKSSEETAKASETAAKASETAAAESASAAQQSATSAAESAAVYDNVVADVTRLKQDIAAVSAVCGTIENTEGGTVIQLTDCVERPLKGLRIFGRTVQDGTPTPDTPIPFVSVGNGGSITVTIETPQNESAPQAMAIDTENGLAGISGTVCDEIDFARGVRIVRFKHKRVSPNLKWNYSSATNRFFSVDKDYKLGDFNSHIPNVVCTHFKAGKGSGDKIICYINDSSNGYAFRYSALNGDVSAWKNFLTNNEVYIIGELGRAIEIPLTTDEISAYSTLHTYKPNTTIYNDADSEMEVGYQADTKLYIDKQFAELRNAIVSLGGNV